MSNIKSRNRMSRDSSRDNVHICCVSLPLMHVKMYFLASILALLAVASAQRPEPCATPPEWTGRMFQYDHTKNFTVLGKLSYDKINERVRLIEEVDLSGKKSFYDYIVLYREERVYRIELSTNGSGECTEHEFHEPFRPAQVPRDAKFAMEAYIGSGAVGGVGVLVNTFYWEMKEQEVTMYYVSTVTAVGCIPVSTIAYSKETGAFHSSFYDVMLGVDPEHFIPPSDCKPGKPLKKFPSF